MVRTCTQRGTRENALLVALRDVPNWASISFIVSMRYGSFDAVIAWDIVVGIDVTRYCAECIFSILPGVAGWEDHDRAVSQGLLVYVSPDVLDDDKDVV